MRPMYLFFVHSYLASKIEKKEKMEEKNTMRLKKSFLVTEAGFESTTT